MGGRISMNNKSLLYRGVFKKLRIDKSEFNNIHYHTILISLLIINGLLTMDSVNVYLVDQ